MSNDRQLINAAAAPAAVGAYSHAVRHGGLLFCSGQLPLDPASGQIVDATPAEQARRCLANLALVCEAGGTTLQQALRCTIYMTDLGAFAEVNLLQHTATHTATHTETHTATHIKEVLSTAHCNTQRNTH